MIDDFLSLKNEVKIREFYNLQLLQVRYFDKCSDGGDFSYI